MKHKIITTCLLIFACCFLQAQNDKLRVAVFDPTSSGTGVDEGTKMAVREIISSTFVNTGMYTIVERSLIERVMQEQKFSNSGAVEDSQASEIGKLIGANKIVLSVITLAGGRNMLSLKLVDVMTANVERQKTQIITTSELLNVVEPLTLQLMGDDVSLEIQTPIAANQNVEKTERATAEPAAPPANVTPTPAPTPAPSQYTNQNETGVLTADRGDVYLNRNKMNKNEVRAMMEGTDALREYNSGLSKYKAGTFIKLGGGVFLIAGAVCLVSAIVKDNENTAKTAVVLGAASIPTFIAGGVVKSSGKRTIRSSVQNYNQNFTSSNVEYGIGFTQNGLGFAINF